MKKNRKGFTLIELLIVVAIIGIIVAIAIPNLLNAIQRAKQKKSMGDQRTNGGACEAYGVDWGFYPDVTGIAGLQTKLTPTYIAVVPQKDGWESAFFFATSANGSQYTIVSYGRDKIASSAPGTGSTTSFNDDIIFVTGQFSRKPEGTQY